MNFDFLIPYIQYLVYLIIILLAIYIRALITERAKASVLRKQNKILIEEKEEIKSKYNKEIEGIKKEHQLDVEKRKYQYESKKEQYLNFFKLLDDFGSNSNLEMQKKMLPIINEFNRNYLKAASLNNKKEETKAITVFSEKIHKLSFKANSEIIRIKQETSTIRIIASDQILKTLDLMELAYDKSFDESTKMLTELPTQILSNDQEAMAKNQQNLQAIGNVILKYKDDLIKQMRIELNEI